MKKIILLRIVHSVFALYFVTCLSYLYYAALTGDSDIFLAIAFISLAIEGFVIYVLNSGDCPLTHIQKRLNDNVPFFELFFPKSFAQNAFRIFSFFTWLAVLLLILRFFLIPLL